MVDKTLRDEVTRVADWIERPRVRMTTQKDRESIETPEHLYAEIWARDIEQLRALRRHGVVVAGKGVVRVWPRRDNQKICDMGLKEVRELGYALSSELPRYLERYTRINPRAAMQRLGLEPADPRTAV